MNQHTAPPQTMVLPSAHCVALPSPHTWNLQPAALLLMQVALQLAPATQVIGGQVLPWQSTVQLLFV